MKKYSTGLNNIYNTLIFMTSTVRKCNIYVTLSILIFHNFYMTFYDLVETDCISKYYILTIYRIIISNK